MRREARQQAARTCSSPALAAAPVPRRPPPHESSTLGALRREARERGAGAKNALFARLEAPQHIAQRKVVLQQPPCGDGLSREPLTRWWLQGRAADAPECTIFCWLGRGSEGWCWLK